MHARVKEVVEHIDKLPFGVRGCTRCIAAASELGAATQRATANHTALARSQMVVQCTIWVARGRVDLPESDEQHDWTHAAVHDVHAGTLRASLGCVVEERAMMVWYRAIYYGFSPSRDHTYHSHSAWESPPKGGGASSASSARKVCVLCVWTFLSAVRGVLYLHA